MGRLPKLAELRLQDNPLTGTMRPGAMRLVVIAKIATLVGVNGGEVRARERVEAE
eukprot:CAMPEP_0173403912 /NCGR_PEP_ID=MMETSP1356-20130122/57969_1 /TAXON_ID=77927 ORGANISM="Hemiselmis virescens, Strain PCC157" /NCGR_SAMPLE_ID=MMETSP1356 /ASSEMBLY_ACC=CAM_ASM_000847 /LENGTH=54 /DNA_ID=CAMNT_0014364499 /DNA_START=94 /DNA_END=255 /DNA_ORIENTATION=-